MFVFYKMFKNKKLHIFIISFFVFIVLNIIENYVHYNIGRNRGVKYIKLSNPTKIDWMKIIIIMLIFAILQGIFTYLLD